MILEQETFEEYGYWSDELALQSHKQILAICDGCGKPRITSNNGYRTLCLSCAEKGEKNGFFGKNHNETTREKMRKNHPDVKGTKSYVWKGGKIKIRCDNCGGIKLKYPSHIKGRKHNFCSKKCWIEWSSVNEEHREHHRELRKNQKPQPTHHTKEEMIFEQICKNNNLPFKYTGDGAFWIGKNPAINPDFVNCNGKKVAIEIFGDYWHSPLLKQNISYSQSYEGRNKILKEYGWKLVVFWGTDLLREDAEQFILNKLKGV